MTPGELVLDIGAGTGRFTAPLARRGADVRAIELDAALARALRARFASAPNVRVVERDALLVPLPAGPFRVVANLPFGRTTAILRRVLARPLVQADVIVEWAFARKRASVWPSTLLGVCWAATFEAAVVRRLPARCFEPRPSVDAALLRLRRRRVPLVDDPRAFESFVRAAFAAGSLRVAASRTVERVGRAHGFDGRTAPRDLDVHQWAALFAAVRRSGYATPRRRRL